MRVVGGERSLRNLHEAIRLIHSHGQGVFYQRVFAAMDLVFDGSRYALELFGPNGEYAMESTLPFSECRESGFVERTEELVRTQSPMFERLAAGESSPMRLSDFMSVRQLKQTDLYQEIFTRLGIRRQIGIPIQSSKCMGGLTINRDTADYTDADLGVARVLADQIATAFEVDVMIRGLTPVIKKQQGLDHAKLRRLGMSRRECEVLGWLVQGKRDSEVAVILNISPRTVEQHVRAILRKLKVETRTAAAAQVLKDGLLEA